MARDHELLEHALGAGGADVVLVEHFQQRGADHARDHGAVAVADRHRRPDELREIGERIDIDRRERDRRQPVEQREQGEHDQHAEPERRDRQAADRQNPDHIVDPGIAEQRGQRAHRNGEQDRDHGRHQGDLQRQFEPQRDLLHHRPLGPHRLAEVELRHADHPLAELDEQRLVEAESLALQLDRLLRDAAAVAAQLDLDDVARHDAQHEEHEHRHADQRRDHQQDAVDGVAEHK